MSLIEQIISLLFSFLYGIIIYKLYNLFYKYLYIYKNIYSLFNSLLFLIDSTLVYFIIMYKINDGMVEIVFIIITIFTFIIFNYNNLQKKCQNKSNQL